MIGFGAHDGAKHPGRRRVGVMMGRDVAGQQFWAVGPSGPDEPLAVLDVEDLKLARIVFDQRTSGLTDEDIAALVTPGR